MTWDVLRPSRFNDAEPSRLVGGNHLEQLLQAHVAAGCGPDWLAGFRKGYEQAHAAIVSAWEQGTAAGASADELCQLVCSRRGKGLDEFTARLSEPAYSRH